MNGRALVHGVRYRALGLADLVDFYEAIWIEAAAMGLDDPHVIERSLDEQADALFASVETWGMSRVAEEGQRAAEELFAPRARGDT